MKILSIGAHQDDNEFRVGGIAYKWIKAGHEVRFLSVCNGSGGHHILTPEQTTAQRATESAAVAEYLGITYDVWDNCDCELMADLETRKRVIRYIRDFAPDLIVTHRTCDYHADHRAVAQLVQDASYLLTVPHNCPESPAMREMPVIIYNEDRFKNPPFEATYVFDIDDVIDVKMHLAHLNQSQVYEWLPYNHGEALPVSDEEKHASLWGMAITPETTDGEIVAAKHGFGVRFAKTAARFRSELIARYGEARGKKVRFAEAFELCEYGGQPTPEMEKELFSL